MNERADSELIPASDGQRKWLSPEEVERLEKLGWTATPAFPSSAENGRRACIIRKDQGAAK